MIAHLLPEPPLLNRLRETNLREVVNAANHGPIVRSWGGP